MLILFTSAIAGADLSGQMCWCPGIGEEAQNRLFTHLLREYTCGVKVSSLRKASAAMTSMR